MKCIVITKRHLSIILSVLLTVTVTLVMTVTTLAANDKKLPIYCVDTDKKQIAISFDAAWGNDDTETLINILKEYNVPATFFVVGAWVDKYPESVKQLSDAGHQVMNHSNTHPYMTKLSADQIADEINTCNKKIAAITGVVPSLIRLPYGDYNNTVIETVENLNMKAIQWDVDSIDWRDDATCESICKRVTSKVQNGSIVLFHNDAEHTPEALPTILKCLIDEGYEFVFISDLVYDENYEINHSGKQCKLK